MTAADAVTAADLVVRHAAGWSAGGVRFEAVAVRDGHIVALDRDARALVGPRTEVIDAAGASVLPGFVDAHVHPPVAGRNLLTVDLTDSGGAAEHLRRVEAWAAAHPDAEWITGGGWSMEHFPGGLPERAALDAVTGDRPAFLFNRDVHGAWVNTAALRRAGITAATPDPADGRIERDAAGEPTGMLHEGAAYSFETDVLPPRTDAEIRAAILAAQDHLHRLGVTSWQDAWVTPATGRVYAGLAAEGRLRSRVVGALWWDRHRGAEQVAEFVERRESLRGGTFHPTTVKIMVDGVLENRTGAMLEPYCRCGDDRGLVYVPPEALAEAVTLLEQQLFQVHFHAIGDRAVRLSLDAVAAARAAAPDRDLRHHIAHVQVVHPADVPRFAELGVTANLQTFWAQHEPQMDELTVPLLGAERAALQYPFRTLEAAGTALAMGSDWAVSTADPLQQLEVAVRRCDPAARAQPSFLPAERLSLKSALTAATAGSARVNHDPDGGRIAVGARADLVVLDRDILADPSGFVADAAVTTTLVAGHVVHRPV